MVQPPFIPGVEYRQPHSPDVGGFFISKFQIPVLDKSDHNIMTDVENAFRSSRLADVPTLTPIKTRMGDRRKRRNDFFHSTHLLDLSVIQRNVVEAFCDLFAFGELLFGADWQSYIESSRNLDTMRLLLLIEKEGYRDPPILQRAMEVIREQRRNKKAPPRAQKGYHVTEYPEDFHLRLSVLFGSNILRDKLKAILDSTPTSP
jgi:hypothetical protein